MADIAAHENGWYYGETAYVAASNKKDGLNGR